MTVTIRCKRITDTNGVYRGAIATISYPNVHGLGGPRTIVELSVYRNNNALGEPIGFVEYHGRTICGSVHDMKHFQARDKLREVFAKMGAQS